MSTLALRACAALRMRVSMSAIGSVNIAGHQLAFTMPGIWPLLASDRRQIRHIRKRR
jgi:hypothetical protein